jgi:molecular chaperone GrpE
MAKAEETKSELDETAGQPEAQEPAAEAEAQAQAGVAAGAKTPFASRQRLAEEAEGFSKGLEKFFRRALGDLPSAADVTEIRAHQATVRDLVERASALGGEAGEKLAAATAERDKLKDAAARARADFLNYQARAGKDLARAEELALRGYMQEMLPVLDSVNLALKDAESPDADVGRLREALGLLANSLGQTLSVRGLQPIVVQVGAAFDANQHEAVATRPADASKGEKPGTIAEELRAGYLWKGLVLRPAQVLVTGAAAGEK